MAQRTVLIQNSISQGNCEVWERSFHDENFIRILYEFWKFIAIKNIIEMYTKIVSITPEIKPIKKNFVCTFVF